MHKLKILPLLFLTILYNSVGHTQTGPAGVGATTSNGLWLKADDFNQLDNTAVTSWTDASGNANDANQATVALQPIFLTTSALNGMPIVRFDGTNDEMTVLDSPILDGSAGITYYTVLRPNNLNGNPKGILGKRIDAGSSLQYAYTWFFFGGNRLNLDANTQNNRFSTPGGYSNATNYIFSWNFDGTLPAGQRCQIRSESTVAVTSSESSTVMTNSDRPLILGALNTAYGNTLGADYAEIIHFNYALDAVDHILVQNYLSAKYNITIASNDLYKQDDPTQGDYDFDVAGIGRLSATEINDDAQGSGMVRILNASDLNDNEFLIWGHDGGIRAAIDEVDIPAPVQGRFERVWRVSEVNSSNTAVDIGSIDIRFDLSNLNTIDVTDLRLLIDTDNDGVFIDETPIGGATDLGSNIYQFANITGITNNLRFTIGTIDIRDTPLPIELQLFTATATKQNSVKLVWQTKTETNNDYFTVQRSKNGVNWENLVNIKGSGNSSQILNYYYTDTNPYKNLTYYRLKQTDFDGKFTYSSIKSVALNDFTMSSTNIYPNPANNSITIEGDSSELEQFRLFNILGEDVTQYISIIENSQKKIIVDISNLSNGTYFVKTSTSAIKLIKQ